MLDDLDDQYDQFDDHDQGWNMSDNLQVSKQTDIIMMHDLDFYLQ